MSNRIDPDPAAQGGQSQYSEHMNHHNQATYTSSQGILGSDESSPQAQPLALPSGVPYPSVFGVATDPNIAGATHGRLEGGQGIIDEEGTLPHDHSIGSATQLPAEESIPSREKQTEALLAKTGGPLGETTLHHEKQVHSRDGSHSVNMAGSEKHPHQSSSSSSSDEEPIDEKKSKSKKGKKSKKAKAVDGPKPVSVFQLYRFHTPMEITLNIFALFLAICAGATQPLMT